jgi:hypothetical protein
VAESVDNLVLEHLKALRADMSDVKARLGSLETRTLAVEEHLSALHTGQVGIRHDLAEVRADVRLIKRRLDLVEA